MKNFVSILEAGRDVFASALVDSIITLLAKKEYKDIKVYSMEKSSHKVKFRRTVDKAILSAPFALDIIFSSSIDLVSKIEGSFGKLGDKYVCEMRVLHPTVICSRKFCIRWNSQRTLTTVSIIKLSTQEPLEDFLLVGEGSQ